MSASWVWDWVSGLVAQRLECCVGGEGVRASVNVSATVSDSDSATAFTTTSEFRFRLQRRLSCCDVYVSAGKVNELYRGEAQRSGAASPSPGGRIERQLFESAYSPYSDFCRGSASACLLSLLQSLRQCLPMYTGYWVLGTYVRILKGYIVVMLSFSCPPPRDFRLATLELCFVC